MKASKAALLGFGAPVLLLAVIQLVPYGRDHTNPPAGRLVAWDSQQTQDLARRACFNCHSNETRWPWYASIAPLSWRIQTHVREGREKLNFTAFEPGNEKVADAAGEAAESVTKGEMPPQDYMLMHPEARLSYAEKQALVTGLEATFAGFGERGRGEHGESRDHERRSGALDEPGRTPKGS
jgi:heme-binding protein